MFKESIVYNDQNLQNALKLIESFTADLVGTEIYDPLCQIF